MLVRWSDFPVFNQVFDDVMGGSFGASLNTRTFSPEVDIRSDDAKVLLQLDVPGVRAEDIDVTVENGVLTVKGARKYEAREGDKERVTLGRAYGAFARSYKLPEGTDAEGVTVDLSDGVLSVSIPRHPKAQARKLTINVAKTAAGVVQTEAQK